MQSAVVYLSHAGPLSLVPAKRQRADLAVVADLMDEHIERAALPRARAADRQRLLARRLAQQFHDTPYRLALPLAAAQRDNATHVLIAVPAAPLDALLSEAAAAGHALRGVWTVSLLISWWMRLAHQRPQHLLAVLPTPAGVRHVYLRYGVPVVSRLVMRDVTGEAKGALTEELDRTVRYLYNARLIEHDVPLPGWLLGEAEGEHTLRAAVVQWQPGPQVRGLPDVARRGLPALAELLAARPPSAQLAPAPRRLHFLARRVRVAVAAAASIAAAAFLTVALEQALLAEGARAALTALRSDAQRAARQAPQPAPQLTAAGLAAYTRHIERVAEPVAALRALARGFDAAPAFELQELTWRAVDGEDASDDPDRAADACAPRGEAPAAVVRVSGRVDAATSLRSVLTARERFEQALTAAPGLRFAVQRAPLERAGPIDGAAATRHFAYCVWLGGA